MYMAVPDRNRILFHPVFQAHHRVCCTIVLSFIDIRAFTHRLWAPPLAEAQHTSTTNSLMRSKYATEGFLFGTATSLVPRPCIRGLGMRLGLPHIVIVLKKLKLQQQCHKTCNTCVQSYGHDCTSYNTVTWLYSIAYPSWWQLYKCMITCNEISLQS